MKAFIDQFFLGLKTYIKAFGYMKRNGLFWYLPIPAFLMLIIYYIGSLINDWRASWDPELGCLECQSMNDTIWFLLKMLVSISLGLLLMKFAKYIVVVMLSPLFSVISQKVEKQVTGKKYPFSLNQTIHDVKRGIRIAMRNIMWEYLFFLIILLFIYLLVEDPMNSIFFYVTYIVGFFYYGFSFLDYINERRRLNIEQSIHFMRKHRGLAISIGMVYSLMILVPVELGKLFAFSDFMDRPLEVIFQSLTQLILWIMAAMAPILAIVTATLAMHELVDLNENKWAVSEDEEK
jgi:CysZ protein